MYPSRLRAVQGDLTMQRADPRLETAELYNFDVAIVGVSFTTLLSISKAAILTYLISPVSIKFQTPNMFLCTFVRGWKLVEYSWYSTQSRLTKGTHPPQRNTASTAFQEPKCTVFSKAHICLKLELWSSLTPKGDEWLLTMFRVTWVEMWSWQRAGVCGEIGSLHLFIDSVLAAFSGPGFFDFSVIALEFLLEGYLSLWRGSR